MLYVLDVGDVDDLVLLAIQGLVFACMQNNDMLRLEFRTKPML